MKEIHYTEYRKMVQRERKQPEYEESKILVKYCDANNITIAHIPNETWTPSYKQRAINTAMGVKPGVPDYMIIVNGNLIFIELKRPGKPKASVSKHQKQWIKQLNQCIGVKAFVCYGAEEAIEIIKEENIL